MPEEDRTLIRDALAEGLRIADQITALRAQRAQLTTRALAEKMGYSHKTVAKLAKGVRR